MSENLRVMNNRMVLLNPLVSLLKKNPPQGTGSLGTQHTNTAGILTPKTTGTNVSYGGKMI